MAATLDNRTEAFLQHLYRGGRYGYYWVASERKDDKDQPLSKRTVWWPINGHVPAPPPDNAHVGHFHIYFGINPVIEIPKERKSKEGVPYVPRPEKVRPQGKEIAALNCLFAEFDFKHFENPAACIDHVEALAPPASVIVHSGGGLHVYWLLAQPYLLDTEERRERARQALADWVERIGAEKESKDLARVLRLPGSYNYKTAYGPDYPEVHYVRCDLARTYLLDDLQPPRPPRAAPVFAWDMSRGGDEVEKARRALDRLSRWRVDEYDSWLKVGLALRDLGQDGLRLWDEWSQRGKAYRAGVCDRKWDTFEERRGLGIGSLYAWAKEDDPGGEVRRVRPLQREVRTVARPTTAAADDERPAADDGWLTVDEARALIRREIAAHLANPTPTEILVIAAPAGIGKSHIAVDTAETEWRKRGRRTLYCAPRRNFFQDVVAVSRKLNGPTFDPLSLWYCWEGRTTERDDGSTPCLYPEAMDAWLAKGHGALRLCSSKLCGWEYVSGPHACPYHRQKDQQQPILFAQHAHAVLGHPLLESCNLVIGDESPVAAFTNKWSIPRRHVVPSWLRKANSNASEESMTHLLFELFDTIAELSQRIHTGDIDHPVLQGKELIKELGGAQAVLRALTPVGEEEERAWNAILLHGSPYVIRQADVREADYNHVAVLVAVLKKEAEEAADGSREYISRVIVNGEGLLLLRGYSASDRLPPHVIWLDATANEAIYREVFWPRPVRVIAPKVRYQGEIHQIVDRGWQKSRLVHETDDGRVELVTDPENRPYLEQLQTLVQHIVTERDYQSPAIVTYKDMGDAIFGDMQGGKLHFYGNRGSNALEESDALFVVGTPQPSSKEMISLASMVFKRRMRAFIDRRVEVERPFEGVTDENGYQLTYPVTAFAEDLDLDALHWQVCEAEIIQSLNRARPLTRNVDVWLLTNRPLRGVPISQIWTLKQVFGAVDANGEELQADPWMWRAVVASATKRVNDQGYVSTVDLVKDLRILPKSAGKYIDLLISALHWEPFRMASEGRGRPAKAATYSPRLDTRMMGLRTSPSPAQSSPVNVFDLSLDELAQVVAGDGVPLAAFIRNHRPSPEWSGIRGPYCGLYAMVNVKTGRVYIGESGNAGLRLAQHAAAIRDGDHHNRTVQAELAEGSTIDDFRARFLTACHTKAEAKLFESRLIEQHWASGRIYNQRG